MYRPFAVLLALALLPANFAAAQAPSPAEIAFFEAKIRPVLAEHCYACHSTQAKKVKGGLRLDDRDSLRKGGDSGPVVVPGKAEESLLIRAIRYDNPDLQMPPKGKLPAAVIADLEQWVNRGAPDPRAKPAAAAGNATWEEMLRTRRDWWSLQPVRKVEIPAVQNAAWSPHPVDRFLLAKLEAAGLEPGPPADPRTLIRRLSLVLTGLPPSVAETEGFAAECRGPSAKKQAVTQTLIDHLLASPHFGERWARHWMDVVRFSETHGNEWNYDVHHAWRYRDYLIRAFNDDVPFDRFLREHIAGDLLPPRWNKTPPSPPLGKGGMDSLSPPLGKGRKDSLSSPLGKGGMDSLSPPLGKGGMGGFNESPIGTAFYRFGEVNHDDCIGLRTIGYDILDNQIDTLSKAFQATTVACARCHDHKIDAVSMKDYYALLGILRSSRPLAHTIDAPEINDAVIRSLADIKRTLKTALAQQWLKEVEALDEKRLNALKAEKTTWENPLHLWETVKGHRDAEAAWKNLARQFATENQRRLVATGRDYVSFGDFHKGDLDRWTGEGQGLRHGGAAPGEFTVATSGDRLLGSILPAGRFTHLFSERLNGALRSPILSARKKHISFQVIGEKQAAVRIVSNNCQLNYRNFKVLKSGNWHWITFDIAEEAKELRCYAELMTKVDNPKFPDQLGQLGGDDTNQRVPYEQAAADPRSYFGVTRVVLHDVPGPPPESLSWLESLYSGSVPHDLGDVAARYRDRARHAVQVWADGEATEEDARWLDWLLQMGFLSNSAKTQPALEALVRGYRDEERNLTMPRVVPGVGDVDSGMEQPIFLRGDCKKPGEIVERRYLEVLSKPGRLFLPMGSGRLRLADALADPANPLTARVMVNRIWHHVFGQGLVRTTDDFGRMGDIPSHPELLDWLANRFVEDGWSVKKMIRLLVTSRAFQMSNRADEKAVQIDPLNRLLHHYPARRLEAEAIRDSILAASGRLDRTLYGPSVLPYREKANEDRRLFPGPLDGNGRRSIYIKVNLMEGARFLSAFDLPGGKVSQGRRDVTNVPAQALAMMNDPFVIQQAEFWAKRLVQRPEESAVTRITYMFETALGRPPTKQEQERLVDFVTKVSDDERIPDGTFGNSTAVWRCVAHALFNMQEFIYIP